MGICTNINHKPTGNIIIVKKINYLYKEIYL